MATETQTFKLDLDSKDFMEKMESAIGAVESLNKIEGLAELTKTIGSASVAMAALAVVTVGMKTALDLTLEAESIKSVNQQFEILTKNAGLSGEALKDALMTAADGLIDDTDLLKLANEAVVMLGGNASKLPEIFELARNVTRAFGGELSERFQQLNNALAAGNTRALRHLGLIVDQDAAIKKYAMSLGVTVDALSEQEKKTALLNATLEKGKSAFAGVNDDAIQTTQALSRLRVALEQLKEIGALAFEKVFGGVVRSEVQGLGAMVSDFTRFLTDKFGSGPDAARAKIERLTEQMNEAGARVFDLQTSVEKTAERMKAGTASTYEYANAQTALNKAQADFAALQAQIHALAPEAEKPVEKGADVVEADKEAADRRLAVATKFEADLQNLRMGRVQKEIETATSEEQVFALQKEREVIISEQVAAKIAQLDAQVALGKMTQAQADLQRYELTKQSEADLNALRARYDEERIRALQNFAATATGAANQFAAGFKAAAAQSAQSFGAMNKVGAAAFNSIKGAATTAFTNLGQGFVNMANGSESAADVLKGFFLGALADIAQAQGAILIANIYNPAAMAAGAGLLVLSGVLRALASSSKAGAGAGGAIGAATAPATGGAGYTSSAADMGARPDLGDGTRRRDVTLVIQGNYFETEQTKRTLMEMIRAETDATGFSYVQIGQGA